MSGAIERVHRAETSGITTTLLEQCQAAGFDPARTLHVSIGSAYSVGVEIGLRIALADPAAGRRIRDWFAQVVQQADPLAHEAADRQVGLWIAGARVD